MHARGHVISLSLSLSLSRSRYHDLSHRGHVMPLSLSLSLSLSISLSLSHSLTHCILSHRGHVMLLSLSLSLSHCIMSHRGHVILLSPSLSLALSLVRSPTVLCLCRRAKRRPVCRLFAVAWRKLSISVEVNRLLMRRCVYDCEFNDCGFTLCDVSLQLRE